VAAQGGNVGLQGAQFGVGQVAAFQCAALLNNHARTLNSRFDLVNPRRFHPPSRRRRWWNDTTETAVSTSMLAYLERSAEHPAMATSDSTDANLGGRDPRRGTPQGATTKPASLHSRAAKTYSSRRAHRAA
jgi:hypothetical protein